MKVIQSKAVDFAFEDDRGALYQLVHGGYEQVNVLLSHKDVVRGGHFHKETAECFYVISGAVQVRAQLGEETETITFVAKDFFQINPYVVHEMVFPEDCVMVAMYEKCVERADGGKDIYPATVNGNGGKANG